MKTKKLLKKMFKLLKKIDKNTERFEHSEETGADLREFSDAELEMFKTQVMGATEPPFLLKKLVENKENEMPVPGKTVTFRRPTPFCLRDSDKPTGGIDLDTMRSELGVDSPPAAPISGIEPVDEHDDVRPE